MSKADLVITGKAYVGEAVLKVAVAVEGEEIACVSSPASAPPAEEVVELDEGKLLLPGMVDMHVHMRDLELSYKEDWYTGTLSALAGGVTFVADMPNTRPATNSVRGLEVKLREASRKALVDYGIYAGLPSDLKELEALLSRGVLGLKLYPEDLGSPILERALELCAMEGVLVVVHPEDQEVVERRGRVPEAEVRALEKMILLASRTGAHLHFTHVSLRESVRRVLEGKLSGLSLSMDATLHHMLLDEGVSRRLGPLAAVNPPLRSRGDRLAILSAASKCLLDAVTSDHAPHTLEEKVAGAPGFPGLELALPLLLTLVKDGLLPLSSLELYSSRPAKILGLRKGSLAPGWDADLVVADLKREEVVSGSKMRSKAKFTPFEGFALRAVVERVYLRGSLAYDDGEVLLKPGSGRLVRGGRRNWTRD